MTTPRIPPLEPPYADTVQQDFNRIMQGRPPLNIFRTVAHNPRALSRMVAGGLLDRGSISLRQRELVILRTCALCKAEYEWGVHVAGFAEKARFTPQQLTATVHGEGGEPVWDSAQRLVVRLCDSLFQYHHVDDALWAELALSFNQPQLIELLMLAGLYQMVSGLVTATRMTLEAGAPRFPTLI
jgi:alkylhydroperoxidase family enzyme